MSAASATPVRRSTRAASKRASEQIKKIQTPPRSRQNSSDLSSHNENSDGKTQRDEGNAKDSQPDGKKNTKNTNVTSNTVVLVLFTLCWYLTSAVATSSSKEILGQTNITPFILTLVQLIISSVLGFVLLHTLGASNDTNLALQADKVKQSDWWILAISFSLGFITLNAAMTRMHVPLVMTLRAAEPIVACALSVIVLGKVPTSHTLASLLVLVGGVGLCTYSSSDFDILGLCLVLLSNLCFATRSVVGKRVQGAVTFDKVGLAIFYHVCRYATVVQSILTVSHLAFTASSHSQAAHSTQTQDTLPLAQEMIDSFPSLAINGVCYFSYLAFSFLILERVNPITHTVLNSMRRPATICFSAFYFSQALSAQVCSGIGVACFGSLCYSHAQLRAKAAGKAEAAKRD